MADEKITVTVPGARELFTKWIEHRGGVTRWKNVDLSNSDAGDQFTPATAIPEGDNPPQPYSKPHWSMQQDETINDLGRFRFVREMKEVERFPVEVRMGGNGMQLKLTDESSQKVRNRNTEIEEERGKPSYYHFDYETQEAIFTIPIFEDEPNVDSTSEEAQPV